MKKIKIIISVVLVLTVDTEFIADNTWDRETLDFIKNNFSLSSIEDVGLTFNFPDVNATDYDSLIVTLIDKNNKERTIKYYKLTHPGRDLCGFVSSKSLAFLQ
jgi:hypothetical protein